MRAPQFASRRAATSVSAAGRDSRAVGRSSLRGDSQSSAEAAKRAATPAEDAPAVPAAAATAAQAASWGAGGIAETVPPATLRPTTAAVARAVLYGRPDLAAALLDAGALPHGHTSMCLLYAACAEVPLTRPGGDPNSQKLSGVSGAAAMRAAMHVLLSRRAIRDEAMPCANGARGARLSAVLARRGIWDRALLLASRGNNTEARRAQARATLLAVAAERGAAAPLAALLAALERKALLRLTSARSASRLSAAKRDAQGLARTLCAHLLPLLTRPQTNAPCGEEQRPHCMALLGATARRLRAAAAGDAVDPPPPMAELAEEEEEEEEESDSGSDSDDEDASSDMDADDEEGDDGDAMALHDVLPSHEALFPAPAAPHDAACAAVAASLADGVPLQWSVETHGACPAAFREAARAAACALQAAGMPAELLEGVIGRAAEAQLWPGVSWEAPGVARFITTPPPTRLAQLERR